MFLASYRTTGCSTVGLRPGALDCRDERRHVGFPADQLLGGLREHRVRSRVGTGEVPVQAIRRLDLSPRLDDTGQQRPGTGLIAETSFGRLPEAKTAGAAAALTE